MPEGMTASEVVELRAPIEEEYNGQRDQIEKEYVAQCREYLEAYLQALKDNAEAKRQALVAAGLNPDGSSVSNRKQQGFDH